MTVLLVQRQALPLPVFVARCQWPTMECPSGSSEALVHLLLSRAPYPLCLPVGLRLGCSCANLGTFSVLLFVSCFHHCIIPDHWLFWAAHTWKYFGLLRAAEFIMPNRYSSLYLTVQGIAVDGVPLPLWWRLKLEACKTDFPFPPLLQGV